MKQRELAFAVLGLLLLLAGAVLSRRGEVSAARTVVEAGGCRLPLTILQPSSGDFAGSAVIFHGISANRGLMDIYGEQLASTGIRVFLPDLPGHGDNTQPFSFERAEKCATLLVLHLQSTGEISPAGTILAGHSMGGAIAIRIADIFPQREPWRFHRLPWSRHWECPRGFYVSRSRRGFREISWSCEAGSNRNSPPKEIGRSSRSPTKGAWDRDSGPIPSLGAPLKSCSFPERRTPAYSLILARGTRVSRGRATPFTCTRAAVLKYMRLLSAGYLASRESSCFFLS